MASVLFYSKNESDENYLLFVSFTFNHARLRLSTGLHVPVKSWDQKEQKAKPVKEFSDTNKRLRECTTFLMDKYDSLFPKGVSFTKDIVDFKAKEITEAFKVFTGKKKAKEVAKYTLITYIPFFQERYKNKSTAGHLKHYNGVKTKLEAFQQKTGFLVDFDTIGKDFYIKFTDYLKEAGLKPNTIGSHIKRIKRLMNEAFEDKLTTNDAHRKRDFKVTKEEVDSIYLTEDDIKLLYEMPIEIPSKRKIRDIFVLNCYTGLRHSDWGKVSIENVDDGKLRIRTHKSKIGVLIPIKPLVREILERYQTIDPPALQNTNEALRWIGEKAYDQKLGKGNIKKWLQVRTHTARRSFATNAYVAGIPERAIMQITGHTTTDSFQKYIRFSKQETADKFKEHTFFM